MTLYCYRIVPAGAVAAGWDGDLEDDVPCDLVLLRAEGYGPSLEDLDEVELARDSYPTLRAAQRELCGRMR